MPEQQPTTPPKPGEQTDAQHPQMEGGVSAGLLGVGGTALGAYSPYLGVHGASLSNPCNFPGYGAQGWAYTGSYQTYRWMLQHPVIRLARAIVTTPVVASSWFYEKAGGEDDPNVPDEAVDLIERTLDGLRRKFVRDAMRALDYGWAPFEPIWDYRDDFLVIERLKPLLVDKTNPLVDDHGNFVGLITESRGHWVGNVGSLGIPVAVREGEEGDRGKDRTRLLARKGKAFCFTYDSEAGNLFGRARLESLRETAWREWLDCASQLQALANKISGTHGYGIVPAGYYIDPKTGQKRYHSEDARDGAIAFKRGDFPIFVRPGGLPTDPTAAAKFAAAPIVEIVPVNFGTETPAIMGLLERMKHAEGMMFNGYLRPSRVGLEGEHGTKAESETMTDTGIVDSQALGDDIAEAVQPLADMIGRHNFGLPPGSVRVKQSPLIDNRKQTFKELLGLLMSNPAVQAEVIRITDVDKVLDAQDIPREDDFNKAALAPQPMAVDPMTGQPVPGAPPPIDPATDQPLPAPAGLPPAAPGLPQDAPPAPPAPEVALPTADAPALQPEAPEAVAAELPPDPLDDWQGTPEGQAVLEQVMDPAGPVGKPAAPSLPAEATEFLPAEETAEGEPTPEPEPEAAPAEPETDPTPIDDAAAEIVAAVEASFAADPEIDEADIAAQIDAVIAEMPADIDGDGDPDGDAIREAVGVAPMDADVEADVERVVAELEAGEPEPEDETPEEDE